MKELEQEQELEASTEPEPEPEHRWRGCRGAEWLTDPAPRYARRFTRTRDRRRVLVVSSAAAVRRHRVDLAAVYRIAANRE